MGAELIQRCKSPAFNSPFQPAAELTAIDKFATQILETLQKSGDQVKSNAEQSKLDVCKKTLAETDLHAKRCQFVLMLLKAVPVITFMNAQNGQYAPYCALAMAESVK